MNKPQTIYRNSNSKLFKFAQKEMRGSCSICNQTYYQWSLLFPSETAFFSLCCLCLLKRLYLVKTTSWQHRFFDLANLSPMWLGTYEYMKNTLQNFFFRFETGLPEWIFQIWSNIFKSDHVFVYMKKSLFWAFLGLAKVSRPLVITKVGAGSEKPPKNWIGRSGRPKMRRMNFWPVLRRNLKIFWFYWPNH